MEIEEWQYQNVKKHGIYHDDFCYLFKVCRILVRYPKGDYKYPVALIGIHKKTNKVHIQRIFKKRRPAFKYFEDFVKEAKRNHTGTLSEVKFKLDLELLELGYKLDGLTFGLEDK